MRGTNHKGLMQRSRKCRGFNFLIGEHLVTQRYNNGLFFRTSDKQTHEPSLNNTRHHGRITSVLIKVVNHRSYLSSGMACKSPYRGVGGLLAIGFKKQSEEDK